MIKRQLLSEILKYLFKKRAIIIYGARRTGKTTLLRFIEERLQKKTLWFFGDSNQAQMLLKPKSKEYLQSLFGDNELIIIDEAQNIEDIDKTLKLSVDFFPEKQFLVSGSSSFELANKTAESLAGRKLVFKLMPLSVRELVDYHGLMKEVEKLDDRLVFGTYPEIVTSDIEPEILLRELHSSYLYKDVLMWSKIRKSNKLMNLVKALAMQVGSEVSYRELAEITGLDVITVEKYIDILEQSFIVFRLYGYGKNLRNELKKAKKIFFWDNGIRNAVLDDFRKFETRDDKGKLWENFIVSQMMIKNIYENSGKLYFWRTHQKQEIDLVEISGESEIYAYEIKWNAKKAKLRFPKTFVDAYNPKKTNVIHSENFFEFLTGIV